MLLYLLNFPKIAPDKNEYDFPVWRVHTDRPCLSSTAPNMRGVYMGQINQYALLKILVNTEL